MPELPMAAPHPYLAPAIGLYQPVGVPDFHRTFIPLKIPPLIKP
jgi:hypothetical protein